MKEQILSYIKRNPGASFAELSRCIEGFKGDGRLAIHLPGIENIILWADMSPVACEAIAQLRAEKAITIDPCDPLIYLMDGGFLDLPIAKTARNYKKPHWCPVTLKAA